MNNGINKQRKEIREALLYCLTSEDIQDLVKKLIDIAMNEESKPMEKIRATQVIFDYTAGKPKQDFGIELETENEKITGYEIKVVNHITKDIDHYYLNYDLYNEAINKGEITKETKVIIGDCQKAIEMEKDKERFQKEHNLKD